MTETDAKDFLQKYFHSPVPDFDFTAKEGTPWRAVFEWPTARDIDTRIRSGLGRDSHLTHQPVVSLYRVQDPATTVPAGRYFATTLIKHRGGICPDYGQPQHALDAKTVDAVRRWIRRAWPGVDDAAKHS